MGLDFKIEVALEFYTFKWEFFLEKVDEKIHLGVLQHELVAPIFSLVNSQENKFEALLKKYKIFEKRISELDERE